MIAIRAIGPILLLIAILAPVVAGFRRQKLGAFIGIGWALIIFAYLSIDLLIPALVQHFYGHAAASELAPETPGTIAVAVFGWLHVLFLHFVGFVLCDLVEVLRGLLSKARRH